MSSLPTINSITNTIKSYLNSNLNINTDDLINHSPPRQTLATLICSASIASTLGYKLYIKYKQSSQLKTNSSPCNVDSKHYTKILTASAPGKVILSGEHAVVYGVTAISTAIDKRTFVSIYEPVNFHENTEQNLSNPCNSKLILKLDHVELIWKLSELIAIHNLNINKWDINFIQKQYDLLKPMINYTEGTNMEYIQNHPLYSNPNWEKNITEAILLLLFQCFNTLFNDQIFISYGIVIDVKSDIPIGAGLGSSSAWSTSLSAALYYYWVYVVAGQRKTKICSSGVQTMSRIWKLSYELEKINHGKPSGIDNTTSVYGGYINFKNNDNFKVIDIKNQFIHKIPLLVINTGIIGNTKKLVRNVKSLYNKHEKIINPIFQSIDSIGNDIMNIMINKDIKQELLYKNINELFSINHGLLISLGCGHKIIDEIKSICNEYKFGKGFKITGSGGGGCVIVSLLNKYQMNDSDNNHNIEKLRKRLLNERYDSYLIETGQNGINCQFN